MNRSRSDSARQPLLDDLERTLPLHSEHFARVAEYDFAQHPFAVEEMITKTRERTKTKFLDELSMCGVAEADIAVQHKQTCSRQQHADLLHTLWTGRHPTGPCKRC
jgi:hypothetical protein